MNYVDIFLSFRVLYSVHGQLFNLNQFWLDCVNYRNGGLDKEIGSCLIFQLEVHNNTILVKLLGR